MVQVQGDLLARLEFVRVFGGRQVLRREVVRAEVQQRQTLGIQPRPPPACDRWTGPLTRLYRDTQGQPDRRAGKHPQPGFRVTWISDPQTDKVKMVEDVRASRIISRHVEYALALVLAEPLGGRGLWGTYTSEAE